jgi:hypothetical protein
MLNRTEPDTVSRDTAGVVIMPQRSQPIWATSTARISMVRRYGLRPLLAGPIAGPLGGRTGFFAVSRLPGYPARYVFLVDSLPTHECYFGRDLVKNRFHAGTDGQSRRDTERLAVIRHWTVHKGSVI